MDLSSKLDEQKAMERRRLVEELEPLIAASYLFKPQGKKFLIENLEKMSIDALIYLKNALSIADERFLDDMIDRMIDEHPELLEEAPSNPEADEQLARSVVEKMNNPSDNASDG